MKIIKGNILVFSSTKQEDEILESYLRSHYQMDSLDICELELAIEKAYGVKITTH